MLIELGDVTLRATAEWGMWAGWKGIITDSEGRRYWRDDHYTSWQSAGRRARARLDEFRKEIHACNGCGMPLSRIWALVDETTIEGDLDTLVFYCSQSCWNRVLLEP